MGALFMDSRGVSCENCPPKIFVLSAWSVRINLMSL
jgi:hypothetical protein